MKWLRIAVFLAVLTPSTGLAQDDEGKSTQTGTTEKVKKDEPKKEVELPEVVVKGEKDEEIPPARSLTLTDTPPIELPLSYEVLGRQMLHELGVTQFADAWQLVSGVDYTEAPFLGLRWGPAAKVRGFGDTETTINGFALPKNMNMFLDSAIVERIEYFKGSAAAVQGQFLSSDNSAGLGGGINIVTKEPFEKQSLKTTFSAVGLLGLDEGDDSRRVHADYNIPVSKGVLFRLNVARDTERPHYLPSEIKPDVGYIVAPSIKLLPAEGLEILFDYSCLGKDIASYFGVPLIEGKLISDYDTYYGNEDTRTYYAGQLGQSRIRWKPNEILTVNAGVSWFRGRNQYVTRGLAYSAAGWKMDINFFNEIRNTGTSPMGIFVGDNVSTRKGYNVSFMLHNKSGKELDNKLVGGVEVLDIRDRRGVGAWLTTADWYDVTDPEILDFPALQPGGRISSPSESIVKRTGIFLQDQFSWKSWRFLAGGRYDEHYDDGVRGRDNSTRYGITYLFDPAFAVYAAYMDTNGPNLGMVDINGDRITEGWSARLNECGFKVKPAKKLMCTVSAYYLKQDNLPEWDATRTYVELTSKTGSRGYEFTAAGQVTKDWSARLSCTLVPSCKLNNEGYWQEPRYDIAAQVAYKVPYGRLANLKMGTSLKFKGAKNLDTDGTLPGYELPAYGVAGLFFEYPLKRKDATWKFRVNIDNLTNEKYYTGARHKIRVSPGDPFSLKLSVTAEF